MNQPVEADKFHIYVLGWQAVPLRNQSKGQYRQAFLVSLGNPEAKQSREAPGPTKSSP